ncbi:hypothetical protein ACP70R_004037 [Stipagrostis hirtigluma subsp. patula]
MEARRFGFDASLPPAYKFDPTDADIVAHYLLPRAVGLPNPHAHAVIDDDPASCPPWELMRRHGHAGSGHAFFFGPVPDRSRNAGRMNRAVPAGDHGPGGTWRGQKGDAARLVLVRGGDVAGAAAEMEIEYKRYNLTYYIAGVKGSTGWVMHEYEITDPPIPDVMISRVKITDKAKKDRRQQHKKASAAAAAADVDQKVAVCPEQPGPSNYIVGGDAFVPTDGEASSSGSQNDFAHQGDNGGAAMGETAGYYTGLLAGEGDGYYVNNSNYYLAQEEDMNYYYHNQGDGGDGDHLVDEDYHDFECHDAGNGG